MEVFVGELESKHEVSYFVIKAYILSLFFLVVVLFLAVGDAWTHFPELYSMSSYTHHYYLADFTLMSL
jgi:hypothetical protein